METLRLAHLCERKGWTRAQFYALTEDEQAFWWRVEIRRERQADDLLASIRKAETFDKLTATVLALLAGQ